MRFFQTDLLIFILGENMTRYIDPDEIDGYCRDVKPTCFGEYGRDEPILCLGCPYENECRLETAEMEECFGFYNDPGTTELYTLSLHDALPIWSMVSLVISSCRPGPASTWQWRQTWLHFRPVLTCRTVVVALVSSLSCSTSFR